MKKIVLIILLFGFNMLFLISNVKALEDGVYIIHSSINDIFVLDANKAVAQNGTNIQLWLGNEGLSQKWIIRKQNDGYYEIKSTINDNFSLDVNNSYFNNSSNIQLWENNISSAQKWIIKEIGNYYKICSYDEKHCLDATGANAFSGTNIQLWESNDSLAQKFRFEKYTALKKTIEDGVYTISSGLDKNFVLDSKETNKNSDLLSYRNKLNDSQRFIVKYIGNGYYTLQSYLNQNYYFDIENQSLAIKSSIKLLPYNDCNSQKWIIKETGDGYFNIISKHSYYALDIRGGLVKDNSNIQLYKLYNFNNQKFKFNKVKEKDLDDGYYFINSLINSKKTLDVNHGIMEEGRNVEIYDLGYSINQKWYIEYVGDGFYKILCNKDKSYALQIDGTNINIGKYNNLDTQKWAIRNIDDSYYIISKTGKYIDLYYGNTTNGTNIQVYDFNGGNGQKYKFIKTADGISEKVLEDGIYRISSALDNNMFIDVYGGYSTNGTNIHLWYRNSGNGQKYRITYLSNGYYKISSLLDLEKVFDVSYGSTYNGSNLAIYSDSNSINQQWIIKDTGDGYFNIVSNCNNLYVDVANGSAIGGINILLWQKNNSSNQKFKFIRATTDTKVIDVSYHQGDIDWNKVANSGIYGVILRIGYWNTEDPKLSEYLNEVKRLDIPYGIYLFSYANTTNGANVEANFTKNIISKYNLNPTLGIYYDLEDWYLSVDNTSNTLSRSQYDDIARTYINNVSSYVSSKYKVKIYADLNHVNNRFGDYSRGQSDWIAHYGASSCGYKGPHSLWQYTSEATLDGIRGYVDMNYLY